MAIYDYHCKDCGKEYEVIDSYSVVDEGKFKCPFCAEGNVERLPSFGAVVKPIERPEWMTKGDFGMLMRNKNWLEKNSDKILSGEWGIEGKGTGPFRAEPREDQLKYSKVWNR